MKKQRENRGPRCRSGHSTPATLIQIAGFVVPMVFTVRYVARVQAGAGRAAH
jgi:hypothetical protein